MTSDDIINVTIIEEEIVVPEISIAGTPGKSAYIVAVNNGFVGTEEAWLLTLRGKSAYEIAVELDFVGTEAEWIVSLASGGLSVDLAAALNAAYVPSDSNAFATLADVEAVRRKSLTYAAALGG